MKILPLGSIWANNDHVARVHHLITKNRSLDEIKTAAKERKIVFFGAGEYSALFWSVLKENGITPDIICDNRFTENETYVNHIPSCAPSPLLNASDEYYFILTLPKREHIKPVATQLVYNGVEDFAVMVEASSLDRRILPNRALLAAYDDTFKDLMHALDWQDDVSDYLHLYNSSICWWHPVLSWFYEEYHEASAFSMLDIGPGRGELSLSMKRLADFTLDWITLPEDRDFRADRRDYYEKRVNNIRYGHFELEAFPGRYDVILFTEVMEHLILNPLNTMRRIRGMLNEGGRVFFSTPTWMKYHYYQNWQSMPLSEEDSIVSYQRKAQMTGLGHVYEYSYEELLEIFEQSNFKVLRYEKSVTGNHNFLIEKNSGK